MIKIKFNADVVGCGDPQSEFFAEIDDFNKIIDLKVISKNTPWKNWDCTEKEYLQEIQEQLSNYIEQCGLDGSSDVVGENIRDGYFQLVP